MESKDKLKEIDIKICTCYYFDDILRLINFGYNNILLDEKSYENFLIYGMSYKTFMGAKPLRIWFGKIDQIIKIYDGTRSLVLFRPESYDAIYNRIRKNGITDIINHNFARIRIDSYNSLPVEKILSFHNIIILIKSDANKNKNNYYYNIFLEKGSHEGKSNTYFFK